MAKLRLTLELIIALGVLLLAGVFASSNNTVLTVDLLIAMWEVSSGVALLTLFVVGSLFGFLVRIPSSLASRARLKRAEHKIKQLSQANSENSSSKSIAQS